MLHDFGFISPKGTLIFDDTRAVLHFSVPKELDRFAERNSIQKYDWTCFKVRSLQA